MLHIWCMSFNRNYKLKNSKQPILTFIFQSLYEEFNKLKRKNPQMKTLLSLGGASAGIEKFRKLVSSDDER